MESKNYIKDIQMFINEAYSDNEPLQDNQARSKKVFNDYCNKIKQDLERLEKLEKENEKLKKITQKMLNGLNNIVECKPKEIRGFILLFIEEFEDRFKEVLDNAKQ